MKKKPPRKKRLPKQTLPINGFDLDAWRLILDTPFPAEWRAEVDGLDLCLQWQRRIEQATTVETALGPEPGFALSWLLRRHPRMFTDNPALEALLFHFARTRIFLETVNRKKRYVIYSPLGMVSQHTPSRSGRLLAPTSINASGVLYLPEWRV